MDGSTRMTTQVAISWPYTYSPSGVVATTTDSAKIYLDRALTLLSTNIGQRPMLPSYGVDWSKSFFEHDGNARVAIESAIRSSVAVWLPQIKVSSVEFIFDNNSGVESVKVNLILPDNTTASLPINLATLSTDGTIKG